MAFRSLKNGNIITTSELEEMYGHFRKDFPDRCQTFEEYLDRFFRNDDFEEIEVHTYGMRLRGFSPGCQPMKGLLFTADDESGRYHDLLVYDRELTDKELSEYELDYIGEGKMVQDKVPHHKN